MEPINDEYIKLLGRQMKERALQVKKPTRKEMLFFYFKVIIHSMVAVIAVLVIDGRL
ncbi:hypothetical protein [Morganella psychrotolerans]|uniref:hypothetical protein n=1 Tax=Morganella psychrotolerans TaxID=368603 RepID=UPI000A94DC85|nr:hypothetical protein [Morganella psychrotolerans]